MSNSQYYTWGARLADMDQDGIIDIISSTSDAVYFAKGLGNGEFEPCQQLFTTYQYEERLAVHTVVDIDADGDNDLFVRVGGILRLLRTVAPLVFEDEVVIEGNGNVYPSIIDLNGDSYPDFVYADWDRVSFYVNIDGYTFDEIYTEYCEEYDAPQITIIDMDHDGLNDVVKTVHSGYAHWYKNYGTGDSIQPLLLFYQDEYDFGQVGFINEDNIPDFTMITEDYLFTPNNLVYLLGEEGPAYNYNDAEVVLSGFTDLSLPRLVDWDMDGFSELFLSAEIFTGAINGYINGWEFYNIDSNLDLTLELQLPGAGGMWRDRIDLNDDGLVDFLSTGGVGGRLQVHLSNENGNYNNHSYDQSYSASRDVFQSDLDGNGYEDLIVFKEYYSSLAVYWNENGILSEPELIFENYEGLNLNILDFDDDGDQDFALTPNYDNNSVWFLTNNNGEFTVESYSLPVDFYNSSVIGTYFSDFNQDDIIDLVFYSFEEDSKVFLSSENSYFDLQVDSPIAGIVMLVHDLDFDLDFDILSLTNTGCAAYLNRLNEGLGFELNAEMTQGLEYVNTHIAEEIYYNADSLVDLVLVSSNDPSYILISNGEGFNAPIQIQLELSDPYWFDYNDDGMTDCLNESATGGYILALQTGEGFELKWQASFDGIPLAHLPTIENDDFFVYHYLYNQIFYEKLSFNPEVEIFDGYVFGDENADAVMNNNDYYLDIPVQVSSSDMNYTFSSGGFFYYIGSANDGIITPLYDSILWQLTTDSAVYNISTLLSPSDTIAFGFAPTNSQHHIHVHSSMLDFGCTDSLFTVYLSLHNDGNMPESGLLTLVGDFQNFQPLPSIGSAFSINGDTLTIPSAMMLPGQHQYYQIEFLHPGVSMMDSLFVLNFYYQSDSLNFGQTIQELVLCAYDPNEMMVSPKGWSEAGYILNSDTLTYTVHFQNLGNAPAQDVRITDVLESKLDYSTFDLISSSHDLSYCITDEGFLQFDFHDIMLQPEELDEAASKGFVTFSFSLAPELAHGETITNSANIYFDLNPAIATNDVQNVILDCQNLIGVSILDSALCTGDVLTAMASGHYIVNYNWSVNNAPTVTNPIYLTDTLIEGTHLLQLITSNPICNMTSLAQVQIAQPTLTEIARVDGQLMVSADLLTEWSLDDEPIAEVSPGVVAITAQGQYCVSVSTNGICWSEKVCINEEVNSVLIYPNPANGVLNIVLPGNSGAIRLYDLSGKLLLDKKLFHFTSVAMNGVAPGVYHVQVVDEAGHHTWHKIVKH
ncbi:MAG: FG-GAP-like repeat-containing protein [Flavobacteriales bacterium]